MHSLFDWAFVALFILVIWNTISVRIISKNYLSLLNEDRNKINERFDMVSRILDRLESSIEHHGRTIHEIKTEPQYKKGMNSLEKERFEELETAVAEFKNEMARRYDFHSSLNSR